MCFRHVMTGAMLCLLFLFMNCDTMQDIKKIENEANNLTLLSVSRVSGGGLLTPAVCHDEALELILENSRPYTITTSGIQQIYYYITIPSPIPGVAKDLTVTASITSGVVGLKGYLYNTDCDYGSPVGDWKGGFTLISHITTSGRYVVLVWTNGDTGSFTISAHMD